jgi:hypothetical protein
MSRTIPDVFIIESLEFEDEEENLFEGKILSDILRLNKKNPIYYYIRTRQEFEEVLEIFDKSNYRYLHISSHGTNESLETTLDTIGFKELSELLRPRLRYKRLFLSACEMVNRSLASKLLTANSKCHSVIGPNEPIYFTDATIFWSSFYHLIFKINESSMKLQDIQSKIGVLTKTFDIQVDYYSASNSLKQGYSYKKIRS